LSQLARITSRIFDRARRQSFDEMALVYTHLAMPMGVLIDVGAHTGGSLKRFPNWDVLAIEPDPSNRAILKHRYGNRPNIRIDPRAVSETDGEALPLFTSSVSSGISSLRPFHRSHRPTTQVTTVRLDTLLEGLESVTVLKTDTEGWDLPVLRSFPWERMHPKVVVCEFEDRKTNALGYNFEDLAEFLTNHGYSVLVSEWYPVVEYGRRHRWRSLRPYPAVLEDANAWGNLIATTDHIAAVLLAAVNRGASTKASDKD
jgi:FkbM family methyltransferase